MVWHQKKNKTKHNELGLSSEGAKNLQQFDSMDLHIASFKQVGKPLIDKFFCPAHSFSVPK